MPLDVEQLLQRLESSGFEKEASTLHVLFSSTAAVARSRPASPQDEQLPARLGPFEVIGELGEGGFGVVLLGAQREPVKRLAAVKLLKRGMDSRSVLARFRGEQQALALMDHPAVATVFESGLAEDGRPWFAMPLVAGVPITAHADLERLGLRERLRLFRRAAEGVLHAHQKGVIHRDLKPANMLVGVEGDVVQPRVIDFGIAKAVEGADPLTSLATMGEALVGTPAYMAPEQVAGQAEVRSDVWALGVILGELLAGARPLDRDPVRGANGVVETARFQRPSLRYQRWLQADRPQASEAAERRGLAPESLMQALQNDLDAIVGRCMEEEPHRRYAGVAELIEDIDRHLDGRPVMARPASLGYRTRRFVGRHRLAVSAGVVTAIALVAATIISLISAWRARDEALASRAVTDFLVETLGSADPWKPEGQQDIRVRDALDAAANKLRDGAFAGQSLQAARVSLAIGSTRLQLGLAAEALPLLDKSLELMRGSSVGDASVVAEVQHQRALCLQALGRAAEGEAPMRESLQLHERIDGRASSPTVRAMNDLALLLKDAGRVDDVEPLLRDALARVRAMPELDEASIASTTGNLGMFLQEVGRAEEARLLIQETLDRNRRRLGADALELSMDYNNLALLQKDLGEVEPAERNMREAIRIMEKGLGPQHPNVALVQINLADTLQRRGRADEAIAVLHQAVSAYEKTYGPTHPEVARAKNLLGFALRDAGNMPQAEANFREAVRVWKATVGNEHPDVASGLNNIARALQDQGRAAEALPISTEAVAIIEKTVAKDDPRRWVFLGRRGSILSDLGQWSAAAQALEQALAGLEAAQAPAARKKTVLEALLQCNQSWAKSDPAANRAAQIKRCEEQLAALKSGGANATQ
jgi:non-specific serine/threonine protein kinase/serine/threonine-protein kinase